MSLPEWARRVAIFAAWGLATLDVLPVVFDVEKTVLLAEALEDSTDRGIRRPDQNADSGLLHPSHSNHEDSHCKFSGDINPLKKHAWNIESSGKDYVKSFF